MVARHGNTGVATFERPVQPDMEALNSVLHADSLEGEHHERAEQETAPRVDLSTQR